LLCQQFKNIVDMELFRTKSGFETCINNDDNVETYKATEIANGLYMGQVFHKKHMSSICVYSYEARMGSDKEPTWIGSINHDTKSYTHCHGYYANHSTGIKFRNYCENELGYSRK
jgi:hypothetical protein